MSLFERLENKVTKTELIDRMIRLSQIHCSQVAEPQFYAGEGPFLFAMNDADGPPKFLCFSFATADEFLAQPDALPAALQDPDFPFVLAEALDLDHLTGSGELYQLTYNKGIPDAPTISQDATTSHSARPCLSKSLILSTYSLPVRSATLKTADRSRQKRFAGLP